MRSVGDKEFLGLVGFPDGLNCEFGEEERNKNDANFDVNTGNDEGGK